MPCVKFSTSTILSVYRFHCSDSWFYQEFWQLHISTHWDWNAHITFLKKWNTNNVLHLNKAIWPICKRAILQVWSCNYRHMYFSHPGYKLRPLYILPRSSISSSEVTPPCISSKNETVQHKPMKIWGSSGLSPKINVDVVHIHHLFIYKNHHLSQYVFVQCAT